MPAYMDLIRNEIPKNKQVFGVSLHSLIKRIPQALGPLLGGFLWLINPQVNLFAAAGFGFVACIIYGFFGKTIEKSEEKSEKNKNSIKISFLYPLQIFIIIFLIIRISKEIQNG